MNAVVTDWPSGSANTGWPQEPTRMLMPGMVQGWPAGTQRAANAEERLLSQAVAWWDVGQYRDGDRFLRNRGTGGELLDLRLGSSMAPNSNDPLYLPSADDGYVYLSGVAGNSLSVTAPATATQYIAYPLDRSASTATGAVVGGATFTFSTTGSWRLIELLDASNVVVDTIDCDVITSGSATSFTSGIVNQTVTINRSTSGRKSVAVPSRSKGGQPVMLFGTDDYLEIVDNWQHGLLNFDAGDSFSIVAFFRSWATIATSSGILGKRSSTGNTASIVGYGMRADAAYIALIQADGTTALLTGGTVAEGLRSAAIIRTPQRATVTVNNVTIKSDASTIGRLINADPFRVGFVGGGFMNMEFYAAAVFRRALSPTEITALSNYFTGRIA